jgi:hypothetical protein
MSAALPPADPFFFLLNKEVVALFTCILDRAIGAGMAAIMGIAMERIMPAGAPEGTATASA